MVLYKTTGQFPIISNESFSLVIACAVAWFITEIQFELIASFHFSGTSLLFILLPLPIQRYDKVTVKNV